MEKLKVVSLFSGCGGMDLGILGGFEFSGYKYKKLPYQIVYAADHDAYCANIYNANFKHKCEVKDVRDIIPSEIPNHDLLVGGFPCQSFSIVAQNPPRLGFTDDRGKLFFEMVAVLKEKAPQYFIAENVKGLLSANKGLAFPMIIEEFEKAGYFVKYKVLNAASFGVPQKRERVFIVGFKKIEEFESFEFPTGMDIINQRSKLKTVIDLDHPVEEKYFFSQRAVDGMLRVREKMNKGRIMNLELPCNTISSHLAKVSLNGTDPVLFVDGRYRRFTPREAAKIQSFPDSFLLDSVAENRQYKAIGNAVPPLLMWNLVNILTNVIRQNNLQKKEKLEVYN